MFRIELQGEFTASHYIRLAGRWEQPHSHRWRVKLFLQREKLNRDFVVADFHEIKNILQGILDELDGKELNNIKAIGKAPTAELVARYIFDRMNTIVSSEFCGISMHSIGVCEQSGCWAWYLKNE